MAHRTVRLASLVALLPLPALATSLQVSPVLLDVPAPGAATTITLRNTDTEPLTAQIRVFRWQQSGGVERFEPTDEVVASPPMIDLRARQDYTVRVVRTARRPVSGEEAYRLVIDELPKPQRRPGTVSLVLRHVVPVFFAERAARAPELAWSVGQQGGRLVLSATNRGDSRMRLSALQLRDEAGRVIGGGNGLFGYALGQGSMRWTLPARRAALKPGSRVSIRGMAENGAFHATAPVQAVR
ncbi:fimbria/pilus periplasmic chaperone [Bosea sp. TWI1241]|uniref:fimbrial biogenesis chaperone n=1 Tax=Bosea sp. TWI1241 TaxID=3148904 RepID=UPI00320AD603